MPCSLLRLARAPRRAAAAASPPASSDGGLPPRCRRGAPATWSSATSAGDGARAGALDKALSQRPGRRHAGLQQLAHLRAGAAEGSCMVGGSGQLHGLAMRSFVGWMCLAWLSHAVTCGAWVCGFWHQSHHQRALTSRRWSALCSSHMLGCERELPATCYLPLYSARLPSCASKNPCQEHAFVCLSVRLCVC